MTYDEILAMFERLGCKNEIGHCIVHTLDFVNLVRMAVKNR